MWKNLITHCGLGFQPDFNTLTITNYGHINIITSNSAKKKALHNTQSTYPSFDHRAEYSVNLSKFSLKSWTPGQIVQVSSTELNTQLTYPSFHHRAEYSVNFFEFPSKSWKLSQIFQVSSTELMYQQFYMRTYQKEMPINILQNAESFVYSFSFTSYWQRIYTYIYTWRKDKYMYEC